MSILQQQQQQIENQQQQQQEREQIFLQLLQENRGSITVLRFALEAKISLEEAQEYVDQKALQLNANFEMTEEGTIYRFMI